MKIFLFLFLVFPCLLNAQYSQSFNDTSTKIKKYPHTTEGIKFSNNQLIVPGTLIALGVYGTINGKLDQKIEDRVSSWDGHTSIDNILPAVAPASVYILNWSGVHGKHNFVDRSVILGTAAALSFGSTYLIKSTINTPRPDGNGNDAFPSLHTTAAFVGAEFMYQEYKDQSVWYGVAGYTLAATTGFVRIYNDRHWLSDVLAGAGIGILGTKAAYWLYPEMRKLYKGTKLDHAMIVPYASGAGYGLSLSATF